MALGLMLTTGFGSVDTELLGRVLAEGEGEDTSSAGGHPVVQVHLKGASLSGGEAAGALPDQGGLLTQRGHGGGCKDRGSSAVTLTPFPINFPLHPPWNQTQPPCLQHLHCWGRPVLGRMKGKLRHAACSAGMGINPPPPAAVFVPMP